MQKMRRENIWCLGIIFVFILGIQCVSALRLNEIESNPPGKDSGNEWIELYSNSKINITNWKINNSDNGTILFNASFNGYYAIELKKQWLDNSNEDVFLYDENGSLIDYFINFSDSYNNDKTWNFCNDEWIFNSSTKNKENSCKTEINKTGGNETDLNKTLQNQSQEQDNQTTQNQSEESEKTEFSFVFDSPESIETNEEFVVGLDFFNLEDKTYDIKIFILDNSGKIISEVYDETNDLWLSSFYYLNEIVEGPGNYSEYFDMRIKEIYQDSEGDFHIYSRIREHNSNKYKEDKRKIRLFYSKNNKTEGYREKSEEIKTNNSNKTEKKIIYLNYPSGKAITNSEDYQSKDIKTDYSNANVYRSKNQKIRENLIYGFAIFCVLFIIFLLLRKEQ